MLSAVRQIIGHDDAFIPMTNTGLSAADMERELAAILDRSGVRLILTDLPAGSATMAAHRLLRSRPELHVMTGVSLPVLLHIATHTDDDPTATAEPAIDRGRQALRHSAGLARGH